MTTRLADGVRRVADIVTAIVVLIVTSPLLMATAIAIRMRMGSGVLFRQRRLGRGGRPFDLLKFRTMLSPAPGREAPELDSERLTTLGRRLRSTSIDELPSLVNLLRGDITLVGPRPLPVHYWDRYRGDEYRRFDVKPGVTGLAQVSGRNTVGWSERLALDVRYVSERSLLGDVRILLRTVPVVFGGRGVDQPGGVTMHELPNDR